MEQPGIPSLKRILKTPTDFLLYQNIYDILWLDWDPIGINDTAPRDEYQSYIAEIFRLKTNGADNLTIAKRLYEIETRSIGVVGNVDKCNQVAVKIVELP